MTHYEYKKQRKTKEKIITEMQNNFLDKQNTRIDELKDNES